MSTPPGCRTRCLPSSPSASDDVFPLGEHFSFFPRIHRRHSNIAKQVDSRRVRSRESRDMCVIHHCKTIVSFQKRGTARIQTLTLHTYSCTRTLLAAEYQSRSSHVYSLKSKPRVHSHSTLSFALPLRVATRPLVRCLVVRRAVVQVLLFSTLLSHSHPTLSFALPLRVATRPLVRCLIVRRAVVQVLLRDATHERVVCCEEKRREERYHSANVTPKQSFW